MEDKNSEGYVVTKKMKVNSLVAFLLVFVTMIFFMASILAIKNTPTIIVAAILFGASVVYEFVVLCKILGVWYKNYTEKYRGL